MDKALFTAMAKGADKAIKLMGAETERGQSCRSLFAEAVGTEYDLIMTGVQSVDDREGMMGPMLSLMLKIPCVSVVTRVEGGDSSITVHKEYFGGLMAAFDVQMPQFLVFRLLANSTICTGKQGTSDPGIASIEEKSLDGVSDTVKVK
ncbi:MAG: hypothetical protein CM1200mP30_10230 [Pseudomonadota bacterium]|nr:MAG: hypothetical protein CM1200mP30_10230 [Pseudomonadota bacterium]